MTSSGTTVDATEEVGEPNHNDQNGQASVWFKWVAPGSGTAIVNTCQARGNVVAVAGYTGGTFGTLAEVDSDACQVRFQAISGETYRFAFDAADGSGGSSGSGGCGSGGSGGSGGCSDGMFWFNLDLFPPPANDNFANAQVIPGTSADVNGDMRGSTLEPGEPDHFAGMDRGSVWYSWTASQNRFVNLDLPSGLEAVIAVYSGSSIGSLTQLASDPHATHFNAQAGTTYRIAIVETNLADVDTFTLKLRTSQLPTAVINSTFISRSGSLLGNVTKPADWHFEADITAPFPAVPIIQPVKELDIDLPADTDLQPDNSVTPICPDSEVGPNANLNFPPETIIARCPNSVVGNGSAELYLAQNNSSTGTNLKDPALVAFNGGTDNLGDPIIKIYGFSQGTGAGVYMEGTWKNGKLTVRIPRLTFDSGVGSVTLDIPGTQHPIAGRRGKDPGIVQAKCPTAHLVTGATFTLGTRDSANQPISPDSVVNASTDYTCVDDTTAPDTFIDSGPIGSGTLADDEATFTFHGTAGATEKIQCQVDDGAYADCVSPKTFTGLSDGVHTFNFRAEDAAGNQDETPATATISTDATAPVVAISSGPSGSSNTPTATFAFSANESGVTFECQLDGGGFTNCASPKGYGAIAAGPHTFEVRGFDAAGHESALATRTWTHSPASTTTTTTGTVAPEGTVTTDPRGTGPTVSKPATAAITLPNGGEVQIVQEPTTATPPSGFTIVGQVFHITAPPATVAEPLSLAFRIDSSAIPAGVVPTDLTLLRNGVAAADCSGAAGTATPDPCVSGREVLPDGDVVVTVLSSHASDWIVAFDTPPDTKAPDTTIDTGPTGTITVSQATFTFHGTAGDTAKIQCKLDSAAFADCTSPKIFTGLANGAHTVSIRAEDAAGNKDATPATRAFSVQVTTPPDTTAPDTTIDSGPSGKITTNRATFAFHGTVGDTAKIQCKLDSGAFADCTSPKTFASLSEGSHTVSFRAEDAAANQDASPATRTFTVDLPVSKTCTSARTRLSNANKQSNAAKQQQKSAKKGVAKANKNLKKAKKSNKASKVKAAKVKVKKAKTKLTKANKKVKSAGQAVKKAKTAVANECD